MPTRSQLVLAVFALCMLGFQMRAEAEEFAAFEYETQEAPDSAFEYETEEAAGPEDAAEEVLAGDVMDGGLMQCYSPMPGFFLGLGGSYNSVRFDQYLYASGISNVYSGSTQVAYGEAGGPATPFLNTQTTFAPTAQVGYLRGCNCCNWFWGTKLAYKYLGLVFTDSNINSPQVGAFTNTTTDPNSFTGHVIVGSTQTTVNHQLALVPFFGRSFERGRVYFGAGPVVFGTNTQIYNATGFADINGTHVDITGTPVNFSDSTWMWGTVGQVGLMYYLSPTWFLDLSYDVAVTARYTKHNSSLFSTTTDGYTDAGTLFVNPTQQITAQSIALTINRMY